MFFNKIIVIAILTFTLLVIFLSSLSSFCSSFSCFSSLYSSIFCPYLRSWLTSHIIDNTHSVFFSIWTTLLSARFFQFLCGISHGKGGMLPMTRMWCSEQNKEMDKGFVNVFGSLGCFLSYLGENELCLRLPCLALCRAFAVWDWSI